MRTCWQVRHEAKEIYYEENNSTVFCKAYKLEPQPLHPIWHVAVAVEVQPKHRGDPEWSDLLDWTRLYHGGVVKQKPVEFVGPPESIESDFV